MKKVLGKIFIKSNLDIQTFQIKKYDPGEYTDYYSFIKENRDMGLNQFIITSEMMIDLLKRYFLERTFTIVNIEFMEEDTTLRNIVKEIVIKLNEDRAYFSSLIDKLNFLSTNDSIDIKRIEIKGKDNISNKSIRIMVQVNGIIELDYFHYDTESEYLIDKIEEFYAN